MAARSLTLPGLAAALLAACSGGTSYSHEGTAEGTGGRGNFLSDGARMIERGNYPEAIRLLTVAINLEPGRSEGYYHRAMAKHLMGDEDDAIADLGDAVRVDSGNARAWFKRGWLHQNHRGDYEQARLDYTRAIEELPNYSDAYYHRGLVYQSLKVFESAIADIERALRVCPTGWNFAEPARRALEICRAQNKQKGADQPPRPLNPRY